MGRVIRILAVVSTVVLWLFFVAADISVASNPVDSLCAEKGLSAWQCDKVTAEMNKGNQTVLPPAENNAPEEGGGKDAPGAPAEGETPAGETNEPDASAKRVEKKTLFDRYAEDYSPIEFTGGLQPFGYNVFANATLKQYSTGMPVAGDYLIGPGDNVDIFMWGRVNGRNELTVSRDGAIFIPDVGPFTVAGLTFNEMKALLKKKVGDIIGTEINVTMGSLRSIQIFVLGEVKNPGPYNVTAMSTITDGVIASGGPSDIGTLRNVMLKRGGRDIAVMDFYDLFLGGDKSKDLRLRDGDVVFVPTVGPLVGVMGNVRRPAVYELKGPTDLAILLKLAGGVIPTAYTQHMQVERVESNSERIVLDINAEDKGLAGFTLQDADLVKVFSIYDRDMNAVFVEGNVKRPGKVELKEGMMLSDVIRGPDDLLDESFLDYGLIKRLVRPGGEMKVVPFNLGRLLQGEADEDIELMPKDTILVFSRWIFRDKPTVSINGEVRKGGSYVFEKNLTIKDLVLTAGGLTVSASPGISELYRTDSATKAVTLVKFNLSRAMGGDKEHNLRLQDMDRLVIHSRLETEPGRFVTVSGDVNKPGRLPYAGNMTVRDLIFAAGNLNESAYLDSAELTSHVIKDGELSLIRMRTVNLRKVIDGDASENFAIAPFDSLFVKRIPNWGEERFVNVSGEVRFPGRYMIRNGESLSSAIERAGGYTDLAYLRGALFVRESVRELQQKNLDESMERFKKSMYSQTLADVQTASSTEGAKLALVAMEHRKELLERMGNAKAKGRMVVKLAPIEELRGSPYDMALENEDFLFIPQRPSVLNVAGSVVNPASFIYDPGVNASEYIKKSGGATEYADMDKAYVIKVDGSALSAENLKQWRLVDWNEQTRSWDFGSAYSILDPGDTIVVPEKTDRIAWLRQVKDLTQILYQIAVTAGVVLVAF